MLKRKIFFDFINKFSDVSTTEKKNIKDCISNIMDFTTVDDNYFITDDDATLYRAIQFTKNSIFDFIYVYPNIIENNVDYDSIQIPKHWKLSMNHALDVKNIISNIYSPLKQYYNDNTFRPYLRKNQQELRDFYNIVNLTHLYANIVKLDGDEINSNLDGRTISQLFEFYFLYMIKHLMQMTDDLSFISESVVPLKEKDDIITTTVELQEEAFGELPDIDVTRGEQKRNREKIASLITTTVKMICRTKNKINFNSHEVKNKINRAKDKERQTITTTLGDMTREQREIENLFKNHRLERWNKGLQKGLTQYVKDTYDEEREKLDQNAVLEYKLGINDLVTNLNKDIYTLDILGEEAADKETFEEQFGISDLAGDDDFGDMEAEQDY